MRICDVQHSVGRIRPLLPEQIGAVKAATSGLLDTDIPGLEPADVLHVRACCRHVWHENHRVEQALAALDSGDIAAVGALLHAAPASARDDYAISTPEMETLVASASAAPGVVGARLTGAGWGGCVLVLVRQEEAVHAAGVTQIASHAHGCVNHLPLSHRGSRRTRRNRRCISHALTSLPGEHTVKQPIDLVLIGAGQRGALAYGSYALARPEDARIVAVAEPDPERRKRVADQHDIDDDMCFADWRELTSRGQRASGAIIATQDQDPVPPAVAAMLAGYDVLLEKPMAHTLAGCVQLVQTAEHTGRILQVCHVLRYSPFWRALHEVLESGSLAMSSPSNIANCLGYVAHSLHAQLAQRRALQPHIQANAAMIRHPVWNLTFRCNDLVRRPASLPPRKRRPEIPDCCTDGCPVEQSCPFSPSASPRLSHPAAGDSPAVRGTWLATRFSFLSVPRQRTHMPPASPSCNRPAVVASIAATMTE